jgi:plastocyanin
MTSMKSHKLAWAAIAVAGAAAACTKDLSELGMGPVTPEAVSAAPEEPAEPEPQAAAPAAHACNCPHNMGPVQPIASEGDPPAASDAGAAPAAVVAPAAAGAPSVTIKGVVARPPRSVSAIVYVEGAPDDPSRGMKATVNQHRMQFVPHVTAVSVGGKVVFYNSDPFPHNVFSPDQGGFNLGTWGKGGARTYAFKQPGIYSLLCNLHPGMLAYVAAVPSSYYSVTDRNGAFEIKGVPGGTYKLTAIGPKLSQSTKTLKAEGSEVVVDFSLEKSK